MKIYENLVGMNQYVVANMYRKLKELAGFTENEEQESDKETYAQEKLHNIGNEKQAIKDAIRCLEHNGLISKLNEEMRAYIIEARSQKKKTTEIIATLQGKFRELNSEEKMITTKSDKSEFVFKNDEEIILAYIEAMLNGEVQFDDELIEDVMENLVWKNISLDYLTKNKKTCERAFGYTHITLEFAKYDGHIVRIAQLTSENVVRDIVSDWEMYEKSVEFDAFDTSRPRNSKGENIGRTYLSTLEESQIWIKQLKRCNNLLQDKKFIHDFLKHWKERLNEDDSLKDEKSNQISVIVSTICSEKSAAYEDKETFLEVLHFISIGDCSCYDDIVLPEKFSKDKDVAYEYILYTGRIDGIDKSILEDREFVLRILDGISKSDYLNNTISESITEIELDECQSYYSEMANYILESETFAEDKEVISKLVKNCGFISKVNENLLDDREFMLDVLRNGRPLWLERQEWSLPKKYSTDKEILLEYFKTELNERRDITVIDRSLFADKEFMLIVLESFPIIPDSWEVPEEILKDSELSKKYAMNLIWEYYEDFEEEKTDQPEYMEKMEKKLKRIRIEILNEDEIFEQLERIGINPNDLLLDSISDKLESTRTVIVPSDNSLDVQMAIKALKQWAEDNDLIKIGEGLNIEIAADGQIKPGFLNIGLANKNGSYVISQDTDTVVVDADLEMGVGSICEALSKIGLPISTKYITEINAGQKNSGYTLSEVDEILRQQTRISEINRMMGEVVEKKKNDKALSVKDGEE